MLIASPFNPLPRFGCVSDFDHVIARLGFVNSLIVPQVEEGLVLAGKGCGLCFLGGGWTRQQQRKGARARVAAGRVLASHLTVSNLQVYSQTSCSPTPRTRHARPLASQGKVISSLIPSLLTVHRIVPEQLVVERWWIRCTCFTQLFGYLIKKKV